MTDQQITNANTEQVLIEKAEKRKQAFEFFDLVQKARKDEARLFLIIGKALKTIRDNRLYLYLGDGGFDSFIQFLNNAEVGISQASAYLYIRVFEFYVQRLKMLEDEVIAIPLNRLQRLLPVIKNKEDNEAKQIIEETGKLTSYDFDKETKERKLVDAKRPIVYKDKETDKYVIYFNPDDVKAIMDTKNGKTIYENNIASS